MDPNCKVFIQKLSSLLPEGNEAELIDYLSNLTRLLEGAENPQDVIPAIFDFFEKFPLIDMGTPGPLVHFSERFYPYYFELLLSSIERKPTSYTLWMLNRILNANITSIQRVQGLSALKAASVHPTADAVAKDQALRFFDHQNVGRA